jgi:phosphoesterase RecJ-like protein
MNPTPKTIIDALQKAHRVLIIPHAKPDGDALGSALALSHFLDDHNIPHDLYCVDTPAPYFMYLPKIQSFLSIPPDLTAYDVIVILDSGDIGQTGMEQQLLTYTNELHPTTTIVIDHHISNARYGNINYIDTHASSTCEILYQLFKKDSYAISTNCATCLMTGLLTDTGNFTNAATKDSSLHCASDLAQCGAHIPTITHYVIKNKSLESLHLWGKVLERITINNRYNIAYTIITQEDLRETGADRNSLDGLINFMAELKDVRIVMLLVQETNTIIKGSLRTTHDDVNVATLAQTLWNGGGHAKAAGFKVKGTLELKEGVWRIC